MPAKASVIDLGSNTLKMVSYSAGMHGSYRPYHHESVAVKLAAGMADGAISDSRLAHTIETLESFKSAMGSDRIDHVVAIATSAVREASNREAFLGSVRRETGIDFKVLSEREEALYSYAGAICSMDLPSVVFFDIGGGSIEIVSSRDFEILSVSSLPLGAIRLTQRFSAGGALSAEGLESMRSYVAGRLPSRESLGLSGSDDPVLVGVGGTLRAMVQYDQTTAGYPLPKLHNYAMTSKSVESILRDLVPKTQDELAAIGPIGPGRAHVVHAGLTVISELVKKLGFRSLVMSTRALREGALSLSLRFPGEFAAHKIGDGHVRELIRLSRRPAAFPRHAEELARLLLSMGLFTEREGALLAEAVAQIGMPPAPGGADGALRSILDDDGPLSHRDHLIVALSVACAGAPGEAGNLLSRYGGILEPSDEKTVEKISAAVSLCDVFHKAGTTARPASGAPRSLSMDVCTAGGTFPESLLRRACSRAEDALGISAKFTIRSG